MGRITLHDLAPLAAMITEPVRADGRVADFRILDMNHVADSLLRSVDGKSVVGRTIAEIVPEMAGDFWLVLYEEVANGGRPVIRRGVPGRSLDGIAPRIWDLTLLPMGDNVLGIFHDVTDLWHAEQSLANEMAEQRLRDERDRMARDLHDTVVQDVIAASMALARIASNAVGSTTDEIQRVIDLHDDAVRHLRSVLYDLRDRSRGGLRQQIRPLIDSAAVTLGFTPTLTVGRLSATTASDFPVHNLLFLVGEMLSNIARHAQATAAEVSLGEADGHLVLEVIDNGVGIDPAAPHGFGLGNIHDRVALLGGLCEITTPDGGGTRVTCRFPLPAADDADAAGDGAGDGASEAAGSADVG